ncbi:hypothetical protein COO60DRAFT_1642231 [Scenedesmus sp. NREL 46B-D3]|nr:hypothetical protein COO60DRAFT_1642231 [Scenedesmus sp. NREL 46B-D3]
MQDHLAGVLTDMEALEGRADEIQACQLRITKLRSTGDVAMLPAEQAQLEGSHPELPRESPVLSKIMSPAALTDLHWSRVPAVAIFGCFVADADELQEAAAAGIPVSPSMSGPHPEELMTQMEVFFKQHKYPDNKCFILRDWGFLIFGADLGDAIACFNEQLKETLVISAEAGDTIAGSEEQTSDAAAADAGGKSIHGFLARAVKRLQAKVGLGRTQSLPDDCHAAAAAAADVAAGKGPLEKVAAHAAMSEPSSPMIGADLPDSIRCLSQAPHHNTSEAYRVPSFQTGFKPW